MAEAEIARFFSAPTFLSTSARCGEQTEGQSLLDLVSCADDRGQLCKCGHEDDVCQGGDGEGNSLVELCSQMFYGMGTPLNRNFCDLHM